jgi:dTDP-4-dehydrorhamnose reductase
MRILLLGKNGQLGWELQRTLAPLGNVIALDFPQVDFTLTQNLRQQILELSPQLIVNTAAYTAVDKAEEEQQLAELVNGVAPGVIAEVAKTLNAALIHFSTDYVFDGMKGSPYTEQDQPNPVQFYGHSKLLGEQAISKISKCYLIIRTSWMYSQRTGNFLTKTLQWARTKTSISIANDQIGSPTSARMLAELIAQTIAMGKSSVVEWVTNFCGIYHLAGEGSVSRLEFALKILEYDPHPEMQTTKEIISASMSDFPMPANRPLNTALNCDKFSKAFGLRLPPWQESLRMTLESYKVPTI